MPTPDRLYTRGPGYNQILDRVLRMPASGMGRDTAPRQSELEALADQVAALTTEVQGIKAMLAPLPSFILTGQQVLAEFERLQARDRPKTKTGV